MNVKMAPCVLIVDDDLNLCKTLAAVLQTAGNSAQVGEKLKTSCERDRRAVF